MTSTICCWKRSGTSSDEVDAEGIGEFLPNYSQQELETDNNFKELSYKTNVTVKKVKIDKTVRFL